MYFALYLYGGEASPITTIQNTQASPEFLTLPQVIPTSIPIPIPHKSTFLPFHFSSDTEFRRRCRRRRLAVFMDRPLIGFAELSRDFADRFR